MIPITKFETTEMINLRVQQTMESGQLVQGWQVEEFEKEFAEMCGSQYAVAINNGTTALELMMRAYGVGKRDYVITNPLSFIATARAITHVGAVPWFVDVDEETGMLDPSWVERGIRSALENERNCFIMPVDLHGRFDEISTEDESIKILRDSCQAHGIQFIADAAAYSFHASKNMTTGEGGMIVTDDEEIANQLRLLRNHGMGDNYEFLIDDGYNARLTDLQASIGRESLEALSEVNSRRQHIAEYYTSEIMRKELDFRTPPIQNVYHHYILRHPKRDEVVTILRYEGIDARVYYPKLLSDVLPITAWAGSLTPKNAQKICRESFAIPVHEHLSNEDIIFISTTLEDIDRYVS